MPNEAEPLRLCRALAVRRLGAAGPRALRAEDVACYLAHVVLGVPLRRLAAWAGRAPSTVLRAVERVEVRRDDPLLDQLLEEAAAAASEGDAPASAGKETAVSVMPFSSLSSSSSSASSAGRPGPARAGSAAPAAPRPEAGAVEKEARRILRRLGEPRAFLALARGAEVAVAFRRPPEGEGALVTLARTPLAMAREFAANDWIEAEHVGPNVARYRLSAAGRAWLKRTLGEDGDARRRAAEATPTPFQRQHREAAARFVGGEAGPGPVEVNLGETPLGWLARRRGADGAPFLAPEEVAAGERLREDFEAAGMGPRVAQDWARFLTAGVTGGPAGGGRGPAEGPRAARARFFAAVGALGPGLEDAAVRACCFLEGLEATERRMGWSARSGKVVLKIALGRLAEHYGFARARPAAGPSEGASDAA